MLLLNNCRYTFFTIDQVITVQYMGRYDIRNVFSHTSIDDASYHIDVIYIIVLPVKV